MTERTYDRVRAVPGKHGEKDLKVSIAGIAPTLAEVVFMVGCLLRAEDRYDAPWQEGRWRFWGFLSQVAFMEEFSDIEQIADACKADRKKGDA